MINERLGDEMVNLFIPHRWNTDDYEVISKLLDRTAYVIKDYSIPEYMPLDKIDRRYHVDPKIQSKIKWASLIVCSNRPALSGGMAIEEIKFATSVGKPIVAVKVTENDNRELKELGVSIIPCRRDSLEYWIKENL